MATEVTLGPLSFNSFVPDGAGCVWQMRELEGWDAPEIRTDLRDRAFSHGLHRGTSYYRGRPLVARGTVRCPSLATARTAKAALAEACDLTSSDGTLTVLESPNKQALVRRDGRPVIKIVGDRVIEYDIPLLAADPRKYATSSTTVSIGSGATVAGTVSGDFDSPAIVTLTPGGGSMTLTETVSGQTMTVSTGAAVVVNGANDTVKVSGTLAWARLTAGDFFSLRGGDSYSFTTSGGSASVVYTAAWI